MAISVLAGSLQDCSVWQKCMCIDLIPSSRKNSAQSAVVCVLRECTLIYSDIHIIYSYTKHPHSLTLICKFSFSAG